MDPRAAAAGMMLIGLVVAGGPSVTQEGPIPSTRPPTAAQTASGPGGVARSTPGDPQTATALAAARKAADDLTAELRSLLLDELRAGGPPAAVTACAHSAQARTSQYRESSGIDIRRVSLRHRNPTNAPDALEARVLESFDRLAVERRPEAEHWEVVSESGRRSLRYLRPLVANAMCLGCHGPRERLSEAVRSSLASRYPDDRATGYAPGDVRGAISIRLPIPEASRPQ